MTLDQIPLGSDHTVVAVHGEALLRERLVELGFTRGAGVRVERRAPLGDPLHVRIRGASFAVRRVEAANVEVSAGGPPA